jgi:hypothetical protein
MINGGVEEIEEGNYFFENFFPSDEGEACLLE